MQFHRLLRPVHIKNSRQENFCREVAAGWSGLLENCWLLVVIILEDTDLSTGSWSLKPLCYLSYRTVYHVALSVDVWKSDYKCGIDVHVHFVFPVMQDWHWKWISVFVGTAQFSQVISWVSVMSIKVSLHCHCSVQGSEPSSQTSSAAWSVIRAVKWESACRATTASFLNLSPTYRCVDCSCCYFSMCHTSKQTLEMFSWIWEWAGDSDILNHSAFFGLHLELLCLLAVISPCSSTKQ